MHSCGNEQKLTLYRKKDQKPWDQVRIGRGRGTVVLGAAPTCWPFLQLSSPPKGCVGDQLCACWKVAHLRGKAKKVGFWGQILESLFLSREITLYRRSKIWRLILRLHMMALREEESSL